MIKSIRNCRLRLAVGKLCLHFNTRKLLDHEALRKSHHCEHQLLTYSHFTHLFANMPAGGAGGGGGGGNRIGGTGTKNSRQTASKGAEKKIAKQPIKAIKEKVVAAKKKAKAKKAEKKASHDARRADYDNKGDDELRHKRTTRQQAQDRF
jgi:hypothetical protein